jgi:hypothetical protein
MPYNRVMDTRDVVMHAIGRRFGRLIIVKRYAIPLTDLAEENGDQFGIAEARALQDGLSNPIILNAHQTLSIARQIQAESYYGATVDNAMYVIGYNQAAEVQVRRYTIPDDRYQTRIVTAEKLARDDGFREVVACDEKEAAYIRGRLEVIGLRPIRFIDFHALR